MKKLFLLISTLAACTAVFAQPKADEVTKTYAETYDFGKIKQGVPVAAFFAITNTANKPVAIENAWAGCDCISLEYSKEPIPAGATSKIKVGYNAAATGHFEKEVNIKLAGVAEAIVVRITGDVVDANEENKVFGKAEIEASVNMAAWRRHLEANLGRVLEKASKAGMRAGIYTINVRFLVEKDGRISEAKALNDPGYGLAWEAEYVVTTGPKWRPGEQNGKAVRSYHTQPITFQITEQ